MKHKIEAIVFDLGGVLIDWNPEYLYKKIFTDHEDMQYFLSEVCTPAWNEEQDGGRSLQEATETLIREHPRFEEEIRAYYGRWEEMLNGTFEETEHILRELKERGEVALYALTNWSAETFPIAYEQYESMHWFQDILVSGREKIRKPFPEIFQLLLSRFHLKPEHTLFIDDNLRNVKAAKALGFATIHFISPGELREKLTAYNLLS